MRQTRANDACVHPDARTLPNVRLIGVDWSTDVRKCGVALADVHDGHVSLVELIGCKASRPALDVVAEAIAMRQPSLVAIDAPLGWPVGLSQALRNHSAGE